MISVVYFFLTAQNFSQTNKQCRPFADFIQNQVTRSGATTIAFTLNCIILFEVIFHFKKYCCFYLKLFRLHYFLQLSFIFKKVKVVQNAVRCFKFFQDFFKSFQVFSSFCKFFLVFSMFFKVFMVFQGIISAFRFFRFIQVF